MQIKSPEAMQALGKRIGAELKVGDVVALVGPLGAGKTELTKGIAAAFGIEEVTSPTFVIARSYRSNPPLIHMDAYRLLAGANPLFELEDLDLDAEKAITVIEWGGELVEKISNQYLEIQINRDSDIREVSIVGHGSRWQGFSI
ncbi:MAG: tRNA (adenosine(37)-N6)-threonylcarbamoyltransferase complex ATPase subunit type 1 TsaE [Actinomycetales bacterium]|nr:tRNA (adenosine(37)-N6)-threonylcarbamoyltransferase complex ATPase subunit type 1 TsaE [Actinomycetales bacterium]